MLVLLYHKGQSSSPLLGFGHFDKDIYMYMLTSYVVIVKAPTHIFSSSCKNHSHVDFLPL